MRTSKKIIALILSALLLVTGIPAFATDAEDEILAEEEVTEEAEPAQEIAEEEISEELPTEEIAEEEISEELPAEEIAEEEISEEREDAVPEEEASLSETGDTVYVGADGLDTNGGTSATDALASFDKALEIAAAEGATRIVVMSAVETALYEWPSHEQTITVTAKDGDTAYDGSLVFTGSVMLGGDFVFENMAIGSKLYQYVTTGANKVVFGEGLTVAEAEDVTGVAAHFGGSQQAVSSIDVTLKSSVVNDIKLGGAYIASEQVMVEGDALLTIDGAQNVPVVLGFDGYGATNANGVFGGSVAVNVLSGSLASIEQARITRIDGALYILLNGGAEMPEGASYPWAQSGNYIVKSSSECSVYPAYDDDGNMIVGAVNVVSNSDTKYLVNVADANGNTFVCHTGEISLPSATTYTFTYTEAQEMETLALTVDEPIFGQRPDMQIPATSQYVATVEWIGEDGEPVEKFEYNKAHTVNIYLVPESSLDAEDLAATINGNVATVTKLPTCYKISHTFPANTTRRRYYVSSEKGKDTFAGTASRPYATIEKAFTALKSTGGVIYVMDNVTMTNGTLAENKKHVLITGEGYEGAGITLADEVGVTLYGDVTFEYLEITTGESCHFNDRGHRLVLGEGMTGSFAFLHAGAMSSGEETPSVDSVDITLGGDLEVSVVTLGGAYVSNELDGVAHDIKLTYNGASTEYVRLGPDKYLEEHTSATIGGNILVTTNSGDAGAFGEMTLHALPAIMNENAAIQFIYNNNTKKGDKDFSYVMGAENMYYVYSAPGGRVDHALDENGHSIRGFFDVIPDKDHIAIVDIDGEKITTRGGRIEIPAATDVYVSYIKAENDMQNITVEVNGGESYLEMIEIDKDGYVKFNNAPRHKTGIFEGWYADADFTTIINDGDYVGNNCSFYAKYFTISRALEDEDFVVEGVQVRLASGSTPQGLRFISDISNDLLTTVADLSELNPAEMRPDSSGIGYGSVVLPAHLLGDEELLCDTSYKYGEREYKSKTVPAIKLYEITDETTKYTVVITDIDTIKYGNEYVTRPYLRYYSRSGNLVTAYGEPYEVSVYTTAAAIVEDGTVDADTLSFLKTEICQAFAEEKGLNVASEALISEIEQKREQMRDDVTNSPNMDLSKVTGTIYYVSAAGSDSNTGTSESKSWKTLDKVQSATLNPGDVVLFRRGDTFRNTTATPSLLPQEGVTYSAYGTGEKPILSGSLRNYVGNYWTATSYTNIYKLNTTDPKNNVGIMEFTLSNGTKRLGYKKLLDKEYDGVVFDNWNDLKSDFEFCNVSGQLYLYSAGGDPDTRFTSIEYGNRKNIVQVNYPDVTIDNLHFMYSGGHAIGASGRDATFDADGNYVELSKARNFTVTNCIMEKVGGSQHPEYAEPTRYGNAIEIFGSCDGFYINNNWIYDIYDTGITFQYSWNYKCDSMQKDVVIRNNLVERCLWGFEFYNQHAGYEYQRITKDILFTENMLCDMGSGWCDLDGRTKHVSSINSYGLSKREGEVENFVISDNIIYRSTNQLIRLDEENDKFIEFSGNTWVQDYDKPLGYFYGEILPYDENAQNIICEGEGSIMNEAENGGVYYYVP